MATTTRKEGDTYPITGQLRNKRGKPIDLTGITGLKFIAQPAIPGVGTGGTKTATVVGDPVEGRYTVPIGANDFPQANYVVVFEITFSDGSKKTVPNKGYEDLVIEGDLE